MRMISFALLLLGCGDLPHPAPPLTPISVEESPDDTARRNQLVAAAMAALPPAGSAPYFFVAGADTDVLPLKSTRADITIAGVIADVRVTQVYRNEGQRPLEAVYVFPASTRAAVHGMRMTIGARTIEARIRERAAARQEFEAARAEGRSATLLEQQRPNVFQMSVANLLPGDEVRVELRYAELLRREAHAYELVFPTTVGPRYGDANPGPHLPPRVPSAHTFALEASIVSGVPVTRIESPSHRVRIERHGSDAKVILPEGDDVGNRDFILRYSLEGEALDAGLLLDGEHFLLMLQPPAAPAPNAIVPREYLFVVDVSGSMNGFPIAVAKSLMRDLLSSLRPDDRFDILTFAGGSELLSPSSLTATSANLQRAAQFMNEQRSSGGTELLPAMQRALALPRTPGVSRTIVVLTDGLVTVESETFETIRARLGEANLFAFGVGSSVNRHLIEGMARAGQGEPFIATDEKAAADAATRFAAYVRAPLLFSPRVRFDGFDAYEVEPPALPDVFAERPLIVFGKHRGSGGRVTVEGRRADGNFSETLEVSQARRTDGAGLGILWARARIERLDDHDREAHKAEITALGLAHHLLTAHTSFVAVDSVVRADGRKTETVRVPMPMPSGVSFEHTGFMGKMGYGGGSGSGYGRGSLFGLRGSRAAAAPPAVAGAPMITGSLDKETIRRVIRMHQNEVRACYEKSLQRSPSLAGVLVMRFTLDARGAVSAAKVSRSTLNDSAVERCVESAVRRWIFPAPSGAVTIDYPFNFTP